MPSDARHTALRLLNRLRKGRSTLDNLLDDMLHTDTALSGKDRALANALIYGVLRQRGKLDYIIAQFSNTPFDKINPDILNILRIGLFQITDMSRIPVSAAVNTSVEMAKSVAPAWVVRYVNGLLRKASVHIKELTFPSVDEDPAYALAVSKSFPEWLVQRWLDRFGTGATTALCDAMNTIPPITIRTNTLCTTRKKLASAIASDVQSIEETLFSPTGLRLYNSRKPIHRLDAFNDGWFQVQDEAAQLTSLLLNPQPGETLLDACAGLGGKTGHCAQLMMNKGSILALDSNPQKLDRLSTETRRLGVSIVTTQVHDLMSPMGKPYTAKFDKILLDAPCSGLGVIRRNPDTKWRTSYDDILRHSKIQLRLLSRVADNLKPGGVLVYAVCSFEPEENEQVIRKFLGARNEFVIDDTTGHQSERIRSLLDDQGYLNTLPHVQPMDGFFSVRIRRLS